MRTVAEHRQYLEQLASRLPNPQAGFFGPGSMAWRVNREVLLALVVLRALLLQIAHPKVAQGVADHSDFGRKPFARAYSTLIAQQVIVFGSCDQAIDVLMRIYARHVTVRGETDAGSYQANDPALLFWVYATLFDSILYAYRTFLPPLSAQDSARFYEEGKLFANLIGIAPDLVPRNLEDFDCYMRAAFAGNEITVSPAGREIARGLLTTPHKLARPLNSYLAAATLPARLRQEFGLSWGPHRQALFDALAPAFRISAAVLPKALHTSPVYWLALRRARSA
jgi:uncharacterized protein (DUF2236 family)